MSDIVERLRQRYSELEINEKSLAWQAAAEIEQLHTDYGLLKDDYEAHRIENERLKSELARIRGLPRLAALDAEIERLRVALAEIEKSYPRATTTALRRIARRALEQK